MRRAIPAVWLQIAQAPHQRLHTPTPTASILDTARPLRSVTLELYGTLQLGSFPSKRGKTRNRLSGQPPLQPRIGRPVAWGAASRKVIEADTADRPPGRIENVGNADWIYSR